MKWVVIGLVLVGALVALVAFIGSRLPQSHRASIEQTLPAAPEAVWRTITDIDAFPSWREGLKRVQRLPDRDGLPVWAEEGRSGKMTLAVERLEAPHLLSVLPIRACHSEARGRTRSRRRPAVAA